jgi:glycosyltransferase involved in cell wall biosynthesis
LIHQKKLIKKIKKEFDIKENKIFYIKHGSYNVEPRKIKKSEINLYGKQMTTHNINLLIFGNIKRYKGIIEFLHYFKEKNFQNFQITIAGKPENNEINEDLIKLERNNKNIIVFNHFIPEEDTPTLFGLADYSILPYEEFTTSGVAIYSLSMGVPVIMPDSDFSNELLPNELYGYTFKDFKDVSNILEKINKINFERKKKIGDKFKKEYNWKDIGERTIEIFDKNL